MHKISRYLIIGFVVLIGLRVQATDAHALYSPRLSQQVSIIRQHVQDSQAQNGVGSILKEIEQIKAYDRAKRKTLDETGIAGDAKAAQDLVYNTTLNFLIQNPFDSLYMVFNINVYNNEFISNCLRDDIWSLETLRDLVGSEMVKAYMLRDTYHGALLMEDYRYLITQLDLLRRYGSDPKAKITANSTATGAAQEVSSNKYFFGEEATGDPPLNYYSNVGVFSSSDATGCPDGEFEKAIIEVLNSWKTFKTLASGGGVEWGSIYAMAKANARIRAKEWIRANQISMTLGGKEGALVDSLVQGGGWDKFVGNVKTDIKILKNMVGPVVPFFSWDLYSPPPSGATIEEGLGSDCKYYNHADGIYSDCSKDMIEQYDKCQNDEKAAKEEGIQCNRFRNAAESLSISDKLNKQIVLQQENAKTLKDVENTFVYSLSMDSVAEENIYFMDDVLWDMNSQIKRGYEAVDKAAGEGIPTLYHEIETLSSRQCANKAK